MKKSGFSLVSLAAVAALSVALFPGLVFAQSAVIRGEQSAGTYVNLAADGSQFLKVNCAVGCTGGATVADNADAVATTTGLSRNTAELFGFNGTNWDRLVSAGNQADGVGNSSLGVLKVGSFNMVYNGSNWDRQKSAASGPAGNTTNGIAAVVSYQGSSTALNITGASNAKASAGRFFKAIVIVAGSTATNICDTTTACAAANTVLSIPSTAVVGQIYDVNAPMTTGIRIEPGTGATINVIYQ
jgi:hypothetical protein